MQQASVRWQASGDEPKRPWTVEHTLDDEGERRLEGEEIPRAKPGWSRKPDKHSIVYLLDRVLRQESKKALRRKSKSAAAPARAGARRRSGKQVRANW